MRGARATVCISLSALMLFASQPGYGRAPGLVVEATILLMRHGVRAPLADPPMPAGKAATSWWRWPTAAGELTPHGAEAIRRLGAADRMLVNEPSASTGCARSGSVAVFADGDQRTMETARAWIRGFSPCRHTAVQVSERPSPLFAAIEAHSDAFDAGEATRAVASRIPAGGLSIIDQHNQEILERLDNVLCGATAPGCGVAHTPTGLRNASKGREPVLVGAVADGATAAQVLTLEYLEGVPIAEVGWARVDAADLEYFGGLRTVGYQLIQRAPYIARAFGGPLLKAMLAETGRVSSGRPRLTIFVGHDSNISAVAGLLDLHWKAEGFASDDPPPGGAIGFQRVRDARGRIFVRAIFRSASLQAIRNLSDVDDRDAVSVLPIAGCNPTPKLCPVAVFNKIALRSLR